MDENIISLNPDGIIISKKRKNCEVSYTNYYYTVTDKKKKDTYQNWISSNSDNIENDIWKVLVSQKREYRFNKLIKNYTGRSLYNKDFEEYLPSHFKEYAYNITLLENQLASIYEITKLYKISNIIPAPNCQGCLENCLGQKDHTDCPTGCLHDQDTCPLCLK